MSTVSGIEWVEQYLADNSNGDWEHDYGVLITSTDNPGWHVSIDLSGTDYESLSIEHMKIERSEADWVIVGISEQKLFGSGGTKNLREILSLLGQALSNAPTN